MYLYGIHHRNKYTAHSENNQISTTRFLIEQACKEELALAWEKRDRRNKLKKFPAKGKLVRITPETPKYLIQAAKFIREFVTKSNKKSHPEYYTVKEGLQHSPKITQYQRSKWIKNLTVIPEGYVYIAEKEEKVLTEYELIYAKATSEGFGNGHNVVKNKVIYNDFAKANLVNLGRYYWIVQKLKTYKIDGYLTKDMITVIGVDMYAAKSTIDSWLKKLVWLGWVIKKRNKKKDVVWQIRSREHITANLTYRANKIKTNIGVDNGTPYTNTEINYIQETHYNKKTGRLLFYKIKDFDDYKEFKYENYKTIIRKGIQSMVRKAKADKKLLNKILRINNNANRIKPTDSLFSFSVRNLAWKFGVSKDTVVRIQKELEASGWCHINRSNSQVRADSLAQYIEDNPHMANHVFATMNGDVYERNRNNITPTELVEEGDYYCSTPFFIPLNYTYMKAA